MSGDNPSTPGPEAEAKTSAFERLFEEQLSPEEPRPTTNEQEQEAEETEVEETESESPDTGQDELEETEAEESEEVDVDDGKASFANFSETDNGYSFKVNGRMVDVTREALIKTYQMAELNERKLERLESQQDGEYSKAKQARLQELDQAKAEYRKMLADLAEGNSDTGESLLKQLEKGEIDYAEYEVAKSKLLKQQEAAKAEQAKAAEEQETRFKELQRTELDKLVKLQGWSDEKVAKAEYAAMQEAARVVGITDAELNKIVDHRFFLIAEKAGKWDALQKQSGKLASKKTKPKTNAAKSKTVKKEKGSSFEALFKESIKGL
jgi:hypothetical protein